MFLNNVFLQGGVVSTSPNPQAGGPPLVGCPRLLIQFIRSYPPYWRPFLYPQPEDAPCRGDRDPLTHFNITYIIILATCFDSFESSSVINFQELPVYVVLQYFKSYSNYCNRDPSLSSFVVFLTPTMRLPAKCLSQ